MVFKQQRSFGPPSPSNHDKYPPPPKSHDILKLSTPLTVFKSSTEQSTKLQSSDQKQDFQIKFEVKTDLFLLFHFSSAICVGQCLDKDYIS